MINELNPKLQLAYDFINYTNKSVFLTGKAGTGKTTFLHYIKKTCHKRVITVAPTGVAAINAGGVTIHSFFQLPFGPYIPNYTRKTDPQSSFARKFNKNKINLIKSLDLLIIDEISMVRADLLDGINDVLKQYRDKNKPFGGVQLLMIGDLHQLSPVVKDDEKNILKDLYNTVYFFSSNALKEINPVNIELTHIYRQSDQEFIDILSYVRNNNLNNTILEKLNKRYIPNFLPQNNDGYIILTTHNSKVQNINQAKLNSLNSEIKTYTAIIKDHFPEYAYPTEKELELKVEAQVMFIKNDPSPAKEYYNGKIGKIIEFDNDDIIVECHDDQSIINVKPVMWNNVKYSLNEKTKEIEEHVEGSFIQYPLKLAWAITIHKSQGLTFEKAVIDANESFAHGQVYVALSRCKSLEGMILKTPITQTSVISDKTISTFTEDINNNCPNNSDLLLSKHNFQKELIIELFKYNKINTVINYLKKLIYNNLNILDETYKNEFDSFYNLIQNEYFNICDKFLFQLNNLFNNETLPEENLVLQDRIIKACEWFYEKIQTSIYSFTRKELLLTDNKDFNKSFKQLMCDLQILLYVKITCFENCKSGFNTNNYLRIKNNALIDFKPKFEKNEKSLPLKGNDFKILYNKIKEWRDNYATENNMIEYMVLPQKTIKELALLKPSSLIELKGINGFGKKRLEKYGTQILEIITDFD